MLRKVKQTLLYFEIVWELFIEISHESFERFGKRNRFACALLFQHCQGFVKFARFFDETVHLIITNPVTQQILWLGAGLKRLLVADLVVAFLLEQSLYSLAETTGDEITEHLQRF